MMLEKAVPSTARVVPLEEALRELDRSLRGLSSAVLTALEEQRHLIAFEIHDGPAQELAMALSHLEEALRHVRGKKGRSFLLQSREMAAHALAELRRILAGLRPPLLDELGLEAVLRAYLPQACQGHDISLEADLRLGPLRLHPQVETALFRIVQEAVNNALRHSGTPRLRVLLAVEGDTLVLEVEDWGRGFDVARAMHREGLGLISMGERASLIGAHLVVESRPGRGTKVRLTMPLEVAQRGPGAQREQAARR